MSLTADRLFTRDGTMKLFSLLRNMHTGLTVVFILFCFTGRSFCNTASDRIPRINPVHMVVVFTRFNGEAPGDTLAPDWAPYLFDGNPGSVNHYWNEISFGTVTVTGEYLPGLYELPSASSSYTGNLDTYIEDVLDLVDNDPSVDFSRFDNDGPDTVPGTADDDGYVDFIVLMPLSRDRDFIREDATGLAGLGTIETYYTNDLNARGHNIKIDQVSGCIVTGQNRHQAVGLLCHEYCHFHGALDLYDLAWDNGSTDSAGIGYWGLMSWGLLGWNGVVEPSGPVAPCAFTRFIIGCIGASNANLVDLYGIHRGVRIRDAGLPDGTVYRIWVSEREYFLIEHRRNDGTYYDRLIPRNGLLIWHIRTQVNVNSDETRKLCDLECADGCYTDAGYPQGTAPDALHGGDNLDFYAHESAYSSSHGGNLGDATDVFDGVTYTRFGPDTNPSSAMNEGGVYTGLDIFNIHPDGVEMVFDVIAPPLTGWISGTVPPIGTAWQMFMDSSVTEENSAHKLPVLYLVSYTGDVNPDVLVTVSGGSVSVETLSSGDERAASAAIEQYLFSAGIANARVTRENIPVGEFTRDFGDIGSGMTPRRVQKITLESAGAELPAVFRLDQNHPNPFNARTMVSYTLPAAGPVMLEVFNILGQKVIEIDRGIEQAGTHTVNLDMNVRPSGVYLYRLKSGPLSRTRKLLLIR